jgi:GT2 family glycosyltransferase
MKTLNVSGCVGYTLCENRCYYEDVDICARLRLLGYEVVVCPQAQVYHHAQRSSHHNFRYFRWHLKGMTRFFFSPVYRRLR